MQLNKKISCSGPDDKSRHPKVYLTFKNKAAQCPYCSKVFQENTKKKSS